MSVGLGILYHMIVLGANDLSIISRLLILRCVTPHAAPCSHLWASLHEEIRMTRYSSGVSNLKSSTSDRQPRAIDRYQFDERNRMDKSSRTPSSATAMYHVYLDVPEA